MAQMLVALQAVHLTKAGVVSHPADALDEMRECFLLYGVRAPFGWITRLRTYGKKIQNSTTSLGYIYWSDDEQTLSYKDLRLSMWGLHQFITG
jgi:TATA-binding protein-associated factor Taf7